MRYQRSILFGLVSPTAVAAAWADEEVVAYARNETTLQLHQLTGEEARRSEIEFQRPIRWLDTGPEESSLTCWLDGEITIVSMRNGLQLTGLGSPSDLPWSLVTTSSTAGVVLAIDGHSRLYKWREGSSWEGPQLLPPGKFVTACALLNGDVICGTAEGGLVLLSESQIAADGSVRVHGDQVMCVQPLSATSFASSSRDGTVAAWQVHDGALHEVWRIALSGRHFINRLAVCEDRIAAGTAAGRVCVLRAEDGVLIAERAVHRDSIRVLSYNVSSKYLLSTGDDGGVVVCDADDLTEISQLIGSRPYIRAATAANEQGDLQVISGDTTGAVSIVGVGGSLVASGIGASQPRAIVRLGADSVLVGREDGVVEQLFLPELTPGFLTHAPDAVFSLATSPDFSVIYAGTRSGHLLRLTPDGSITEITNRHASVVGDICVTGSLLITCSDDRTVKISHAATGILLAQFAYDGLALNNILPLSADEMLVSSDDGCVLHLDRSGYQIAKYRHHTAPVRALALTPDGLIASGDRSGTLNFWALDAQEPAQSVRMSRRIVWLSNARPFGDILVVTENEISVMDLDRTNSVGTVAETVQRQTRSVELGKSSGRPSGAILHLSDLHFHGHEDPMSWLEPLIEDLQRELEVYSLAAVIVSGDVTSMAVDVEFAAAAKFLTLLQAELGKPKLLVVPGNHDLSWSASRRAYVPMRRSDAGALTGRDHFIDTSADYVEVADDLEYRGRFSTFADFYEALCHEGYLLDPDLQVTRLLLPELRIAIYGLNSSWEIDHHHRARASINPSALSRVLADVRTVEARGRPWSKIVVWHHPTEQAPNETIANISVMEQLSKAGFRILLHGHLHKPARGRYEYDTTGERSLVAVGAGTFGALSHEWTPGFPLGYNVIEVYRDRMVIRSRKRETPEGAWMADARWRIGPRRDPVSWFSIER